MKKIVIGIRRLSGYLLAEVDELTKRAEVVVIESPAHLSEEAYSRFKGRVTWINRDADDFDKRCEWIISEFRPDVYLCCGWVDKKLLFLAKALHRNGTVTVIGSDTSWKSNLRQWIHAMISRFYLVPKFDYALGAGEPQARYFRVLGFPANRVLHGYVSAETAKFSSVVHDSASWPHKFVYVGRYAPEKNMRMMEHAFIKAIGQMPESDWTLECIGGGILWEERTLHPRINHLGYITPSTLLEHVKGMGCFVLPSTYEPWGVVVHEFAVMGLPLLCSDQVHATTQFLKESENGWKFNPFDEASLVDAFLRIMRLSDHELYAMGARSRELGLSFTTEDWANQLLGLKRI